MSNEKGSFWFTPNGIAALALIGAASYFLLIEHGEHVFPFLPYLILLLCPLMHIFMHGGHGGHGGHSEHEGDKDPSKVNDSESEAYRRGLEDGKKQSTNQHNHH